MTNTSEIGAFKVVSEGGIASGVRRIEAVAGAAAVEYLNGVDGIVRQLAGSLKVRAAPLLPLLSLLLPLPLPPLTCTCAARGRRAAPAAAHERCGGCSQRCRHAWPCMPPPLLLHGPAPPFLTPLPQTRPDELVGRVTALQEELKAAAKQLAEAKSALAVAKSQVRAA